MTRHLQVGAAAAVGASFLTGCTTAAPLPSSPMDSITVEGYVAPGPVVTLYNTQAARAGGSRRDCIQLLRPEVMQAAPLPDGKLRVQGRLGVFDDIFELAKLQIGDDRATFELCEGRYLIVENLAPTSGNQ